MKSLFRNAISFLFLGLSLLLPAQDRHIPAKPTGVIMPVYDAVDMLSPNEEALLNQKLIAFHQQSSTEILVVLTDTTHGEDINFFATLWGERWGIGEKKQNNGVVLLIAKDDKRLSIQAGRGAEPYISAAQAGQIIDYAIVPKIKKQAYLAIDEGTNLIMLALEGKFKAPDKPKKNKNKDEGMDSGLILFVIILIIIIVMSRKNRNNGGFTIGGGGFFPGGFGGGFGGGRSSGSDSGFGGFGGGGSFGGGGASGGWD